MLVPSLLNELRNDLFASESEILTSRDYADLVTILDELTKVEILFFMQFMLTIHCKIRLAISCPQPGMSLCRGLQRDVVYLC